MSRRQRAIGFLGAGLIRSCGCTWRIRRYDEHFVDQARSHSPHIIYTSWHGHMFALSYAFRDRNVQLLASEHRDGEMMGQAVRFLGYGHLRGSSTRGGARAIRQLVRKFREGYDLGITVDGPVGPRYVFKPGPLEIAKITGAAIVPLVASCRKPFVASSWDAFEIPKLFSRVSIRHAEPVIVPRDADSATLEEKRQEAESKLRELTDNNDAFASR